MRNASVVGTCQRANAGADIDIHVFRCVLHGDASRCFCDVTVTMRIWALLLCFKLAVEVVIARGEEGEPDEVFVVQYGWELEYRLS
jgi:hypothetical protein